MYRMNSDTTPRVYIFFSGGHPRLISRDSGAYGHDPRRLYIICFEHFYYNAIHCNTIHIGSNLENNAHPNHHCYSEQSNTKGELRQIVRVSMVKRVLYEKSYDPVAHRGRSRDGRPRLRECPRQSLVTTPNGRPTAARSTTCLVVKQCRLYSPDSGLSITVVYVMDTFLIFLFFESIHRSI